MTYGGANPDGSPLPFSGVTLEQYAGVTAALLEGFTLSEVLKSEGIDAGAWSYAAAGWGARLTKDGVGGPISAAYQDKLAFAQRWLGRGVAPLDEDLAAWLGFLGAWSSHSAPFELMTGLGLVPADIGRIQSLWSKRLAADHGLCKKMLELAQKKLCVIPAVKVTPAVLRPYPWSKKTGAARASEVRTADVQVGRKQEPSPPAPPVPRPTAPELLVPTGMRHFTSLTGTQPTSDVQRGPVLPFTPADPPAPPDSAPPSPPAAESSVPAGMRHFTSLTGTQPAPEAPQRPAVPFGPTGPATPAALPLKPSVPESLVPEGMRHFTCLTGTQPTPDAPRGPALPFPSADAVPSPPPAPPRPPAPESSVPVGMRHFTSLTGTQPAPGTPQGSPLPFKPANPSAPATPPVRPPIPELRVPEGVRHFTNTTDTQLGPEPPRGPAVPFKRPAVTGAATPEEPTPLAGPRPFPASADPPLPLAQYARLHVELALDPANRHLTLQRHGLDERRLRELDAFWNPRVKTDPSLRAAWDSFYAAHRAWLISAKRSER